VNLTTTAALDSAIHLVDEAERDPVAAVKNQPRIGKLLRRAKLDLASAAPLAGAPGGERIAQVCERLERVLEMCTQPLAALGVTHVVRVEDMPAIPAGKEAGPFKIEWPGGEGFARSIYAGTLDGDPANLSRLSVRIAINGSDELFTTGTAPAYVPLVAFQPQNHNWFRLKDYVVTAAQRWTVHFNYEGAGGPATLTPFLLFGFARK
jgi:hypothetical protein